MCCGVCAVGGILWDAVGLGVCAVRPGMCAVGMHCGEKKIEGSFHLSLCSSGHVEMKYELDSTFYLKIAMDSREAYASNQII